MSLLRKGAITRRGSPELWTLAKPIEQIILDNEEKTTTYSLSGDSGLLLGEVPLPAPKSHGLPAILYAVSIEHKQAPTGAAAGALHIRAWDGSEERTFDIIGIPSATYTWRTFGYLAAYLYDNTTVSRKGNTNLKVRVYLLGDPSLPNNVSYCRNCVVTVVPIYKT